MDHISSNFYHFDNISQIDEIDLQMNFLKKIFGLEDKPIQSYADFWNWFQKHEKKFFEIIKHQRNIEKGFFDKISPKLEEIKEGYSFLTGMYDDQTAELILTADGDIKNIVFVEELVNAAPKMEGWMFTALKQPSDIQCATIEMAGYSFNGNNLSFYANELPEYPDEIDITIVHHDQTEQNKSQISNGTYLFLDNYLGELEFANAIDNLRIIGKQAAQQELIPIAKLKDFLNWRQKEFVERYENICYDMENAMYGVLEAKLKNGNPLIAALNRDLLNWDNKASHPWILKVTMKYDGKERNGLPGNDDYQSMDEIESEILLELKDVEGYLYIGRQSANGVREIYFACKDFRKPSKVMYPFQRQYRQKFDLDYDIYKDKYWQCFERFQVKP